MRILRKLNGNENWEKVDLDSAVNQLKNTYDEKYIVRLFQKDCILTSPLAQYKREIICIKEFLNIVIEEGIKISEHLSLHKTDRRYYTVFHGELEYIPNAQVGGLFHLYNG